MRSEFSVAMHIEPESKETIAQRLEVARVALNYKTQQAFAASFGVKPSKWNNYVSARDRIPLNIALDLCKKHRLSLDWIYRDDPSGLPLALARRIEETSAGMERSPKQPHRRRIDQGSAT